METDQRPLAPEPAARARPGRAARLTERARSSPYYPALSHPVLRRVLPGAAASALGDGMSAVAIAWLALKLAPADSRGLWVGAAVAAYSLPGAVGAVALRRWLSGRARGAAGVRQRRAAGRGAGPDRLPGPGRAARPRRLRRPARRVVPAQRVGRGGQVHADRGPAPARAAGRGEHRVRPGRPAEPDDRPGAGRGGDRGRRARRWSSPPTP